MKKIITLTFDDGSREGCNVFYSRSYLVESLSLQFDEPIFASEGVKMDGEGSSEQMDNAVQQLRDLGYIVHDDIEEKVITVMDEEPRSLDDIITGVLNRATP
jgi:hypothetical protein